MAVAAQYCAIGRNDECALKAEITKVSCWCDADLNDDVTLGKVLPASFSTSAFSCPSRASMASCLLSNWANIPSTLPSPF